MKKILLFLFLISTAFAGKGQNLVPNGDFEQYTSCPTNLSQLNLAIPWINPSNYGSPDYFNQCHTLGIVGVPDNAFGNQMAHSGIGYVGIGCFFTYNANFRDYIEVPLMSTLISNECYHFEMYLNLADSSVFTTDDIGIYFSDTAVTGINNFYPLVFTPQISNLAGFINDTLNWTLVSGNYTAAGGEEYLIIGNFNTDANTNIINANGNSNGSLYAYFYIDDISLTPCTGIKEQNPNAAIKIYPNPAKDFINISFTLKEEKNVSVEVYDLMRKPLTPKGEPGKWQSGKQEMEIDMRGFSNGIYVVEINTGEGIYRKKVVKE